MSPELTMALRLLLAAVLGGAIGFQREMAGKPAGLRTHMLISLGAALFTMVSVFGFVGAADPIRARPDDRPQTRRLLPAWRRGVFHRLARAGGGGYDLLRRG